MKKNINSNNKGLGRGLSSLLGQDNPNKTNVIEKNINSSNYKYHTIYYAMMVYPHQR